MSRYTLGSVILFGASALAMGASPIPAAHAAPLPAYPASAPAIATNVAAGAFVRIHAINGVASTERAAETPVHPGDVISLAVDLFTTGPNGSEPQQRPVEEFQWSVQGSNEICDGSQADSCLNRTDFEVTDYGVNYYVPYNLGEVVTILVRSSANPSATDTLVLRNQGAAPGQAVTPAQNVITNPDQYNYDEVNPDYALAGQGRWVTIDQSRYWVPYQYEADWVPYRNGYWSYVDNDGWTWNSYDPWGWFTDHYGVWRHHGTYGWIWLPFTDGGYRASTVTWFQDDDYVGWYPYYEDYSAGYAQGYDDGFDDGYWAGLRAGHYYSGGYDYSPGFTVVRYNDFTNVNVFNVTIFDRATCSNVFRGSYIGNRYGRYPGGQDLNGSRDFMFGRNRDIPRSSFVDRRLTHGYLRNARSIHETPDRYRNVGGGVERFRDRPVPVGSVIRHGGDGRREVVPPTSNGRGITTRPRFRDDAGRMTPLPPRTRNPARPNPANGVYRPDRGDNNGPRRPDTRPGERSSQPDQPNFPGRPDRSNGPGRPDRPTQPDQPNFPGRPDRSNGPGRSDRPTQPDQPNFSGRPDRWNGPGRPEHPTQPDQPNFPGRPDRSNGPGRRERPTQPDQPNFPGRPDRSNGPGHPERSTQPDQPNFPGHSDRPSRPDRPSFPDRPLQPDRSQPDRPSRPDNPSPRPERGDGGGNHGDGDGGGRNHGGGGDRGGGHEGGGHGGRH
jgi:hypothetical protein